MTDYKLVPVEPTLDMLNAGLEVYGLEDCAEADVLGIFKAMLAAAPAVQGEPVGWQFYQHGEWWNGDHRIKDHRKNTEEAGFRVRDVYAVPQPASRPWSYCPECGSEHVQHQEGERKQCANCHQEWFSNTDYTNVVRKHLAGKFRDKDAEIERLRSSKFAQPAPDVAQLVEALEAAQKEAVYGINHARNGAQAAAALGRVSAIAGAALDAHRSQGGKA